MPLPTYPFERERYWIEPSTPFTVNSERRVASGKLPDIADWFYRSSWQRSKPQISPAVDVEDDTPACWLIFADKQNLTARIVQ